MYSVYLSEEAEMDILDSFLYYEKKLKKLGTSFENEVERAIFRIKENPFLFQLKYKSIRVHYLKKFPFGIHYIVAEQIITIIAVFHTSRNPYRWELPE